LSFGDGGIDEVRISEVTKPKVNFATNDRVTWSNFDDGVPRGSIGEVKTEEDEKAARQARSHCGRKAVL
jgi:hypothetical protein